MSSYFAVQATFAEIPGVLETGTIRKIDRRYPFNDACQWFIDHADLIILVYDYAKLDIGPETEALLDQLKGRESQVTRLVFTFQHLCISCLFNNIQDQSYSQDSAKKDGLLL